MRRVSEGIRATRCVGVLPFRPGFELRTCAFEGPTHVGTPGAFLNLSYDFVHLHGGVLHDCCRYRLALADYDYMTSDVGEWRH